MSNRISKFQKDKKLRKPKGPSRTPARKGTPSGWPSGFQPKKEKVRYVPNAQAPERVPAIPKMDKKAFHEETGTHILDLEHAMIRYPTALGMVCFRNQQMDSSQFGEGKLVVIGPDNTFKSEEDCRGKWLNDAPSQRQYPVAWCSREDILS